MQNFTLRKILIPIFAIQIEKGIKMNDSDLQLKTKKKSPSDLKWHKKYLH